MGRGCPKGLDSGLKPIVHLKSLTHPLFTVGPASFFPFPPTVCISPISTQIRAPHQDQLRPPTRPTHHRLVLGAASQTLRSAPALSCTAHELRVTRVMFFIRDLFSCSPSPNNPLTTCTTHTDARFHSPAGGFLSSSPQNSFPSSLERLGPAGCVGLHLSQSP